MVGGDVELWDGYWAPDSVLLPPAQGPVVGDAKRNALVEAPPFDDIPKATFSDWTVAGRDDLAVVNNTITVESETGSAPLAFKQMIVLRRQADDRWLVQAAIFNAAH